MPHVVQVKWWLTFNEPFVVTWLGYGVGVFAPGILSPAEAVYTTAHTILKAHAEAYHVYNDTYRELQHGNSSITLTITPTGHSNMVSLLPRLQ